jgi:hypothetical protein
MLAESKKSSLGPLQRLLSLRVIYRFSNTTYSIQNDPGEIYAVLGEWNEYNENHYVQRINTPMIYCSRRRREILVVSSKLARRLGTSVRTNT